MNDMEKDEQNGVPSELVETFKTFSSAVTEIEKAMGPLQHTPRSEMLKKFTPLEVAKLDLVCAYSINSLFWMHLITEGVNPRNHDIKGELDRIKSYMGKVREIENRKKAPKLQKDAAKRFVRNAMFDIEAKNQEKQREDTENPVPQDEPAIVLKPAENSKGPIITKQEVHTLRKEPFSDKAIGKEPVGGKRKHKKTEKTRRKLKKARSES